MGGRAPSAGFFGSLLTRRGFTSAPVCAPSPFARPTVGHGQPMAWPSGNVFPISIRPMSRGGSVRALWRRSPTHGLPRDSASPRRPNAVPRPLLWLSFRILATHPSPTHSAGGHGSRVFSWGQYPGAVERPPQRTAVALSCAETYRKSCAPHLQHDRTWVAPKYRNTALFY